MKMDKGHFPSRRRATLPLFLLAMFVVACADTDEPEPPLRIDSVTETEMRRVVGGAISTGLTAWDADGRIVPGLAQSWRVSDNGLFIVFRLRGAHYSDGRPILAQDVVSSIDRARRQQGVVGDLLAGVSDVSAPLANIIELRLTTPQPEILELLATPALGIRPDPRSPVRAGPYMPSTDAGSPAAAPAPHAELTRNSHYFASESVRIADIHVRHNGARAAIAAFQRGESDMVTGGRLHDFSEVRLLSGRVPVIIGPARAMLLLLVNHADGPLAQPDVRRALAMAIDRATLGPALFGSALAVPVSGLVPPGLGIETGTQWDQVSLAARRGEARRLLAEAGMPVPLRLAVSIGDAAEEQRLVNMIGGDFAEIGVRLSVVRRSVASHIEAVETGNFMLALVSRETRIASPLPFLLPFRCAANGHGVCLPEADRLLAEAWQAPDMGARMAAYAAAARLWAEDGAAIGLVQPLTWALVSPRVDGFRPNPANIHPLGALSVSTDRRFAG